MRDSLQLRKIKSNQLTKAAKNWKLAIYDKDFLEQLNIAETLTNDE